MSFYQNYLFSVLDRIRGRANMERLTFLRESQYWPPERLAAWRTERLNSLLMQARDYSPFYRERLKGLSLPLASLDDLKALPVLKKSDIKNNRERIKCTHLPRGRFLPGRTGGSTGEALHYYYDKEGRDWNRASVYRSQEWAGTSLGEKTVQMSGSHYDYERSEKLFWKAVLFLQRYRSLPVSYVNDAVFSGYFNEIHRFKPTSIWGYASGITLFSQYIRQNHPGADFNFLKAVITSSENLNDRQRRTIESAFGTGKVYDHYGSREFYMASECRIHAGYHIHGEVLLLEVVDPQNNPCPPGKMGRILITDLSNRAFPFIRYEIGDVGVLAEDKPCPCGVTLPKLARVEGRIADLVKLPDRILTPPNLTIVLSDCDGVDQFQIVQKKKDQLDVHLVVNPRYTPENEKYIRDSLSQLIGPMTSLNILHVPSITVPASGKRRFVISEIEEGV